MHSSRWHFFPSVSIVEHSSKNFDIGNKLWSCVMDCCLLLLEPPNWAMDRLLEKKKQEIAQSNENVDFSLFKLSSADSFCSSDQSILQVQHNV
jgi:hypothetical protein